MKFKINRDHFSNGLAQVLNVVGSKAAMPILSNVLIEAEKDYISLTTTNLDLGIRCKIKAEVKEGGAVAGGRLLLPFPRLYRLRPVRPLPARRAPCPDAGPAPEGCEDEAGRFRITFLCEQPGGYSSLLRRASQQFAAAVSLGPAGVIRMIAPHNNTDTFHYCISL